MNRTPTKNLVRLLQIGCDFVKALDIKKCILKKEKTQLRIYIKISAALDSAAQNT